MRGWCSQQIQAAGISLILFVIVAAVPIFPGQAAGAAGSSVDGTGTSAATGETRRLQVTFINPGISDADNPTGTFWLSVSAFMQAAAVDLDIDLEIIYAERNHVLMREQAQAVAARATPPDVVIVVNEKLAAAEMVKTLDKAGIKVFILLNTFVDDQIGEMGRPRQKFPGYLGSLVPDNKVAGYLLARQLFDKARQQGVGKDGRMKVVAITGDHVTPAAIARNAGLQQAIDEVPGIDLKQVFVGQWNRDTANIQAAGALVRYPGISAIWAANDPMALGALDAVRQAGLISGKDVMIGGLNWDPPALEQLRDGGLAVSVGGHFMTGAWALVLLYDYFHGRDFAEIGTELQFPIFSSLDRQNVDRYLAVFGDGDWNKIDFRKFSKALNPSLLQYTFSLEGVYDTLAP